MIKYEIVISPKFKTDIAQTMQKLAESAAKLAIQMRKLPATKKEHWQGRGKKRKPKSL